MAYSILGPDGHRFSDLVVGLKQVNFGKTKKVYEDKNGDFIITHEDVLTAFDDRNCTGRAPGKGTASAYSSALLFRLLEKKGVQTTHRGIINANTTREEGLNMLPFEVIWRRYNVKGNSWEKRHPGQVEVGAKYDAIKYEACLKWSVVDDDAKEEKDRIVNDPFFILDDNFEPLLRSDGMPRLMHPKNPNHEIRYSSVLHPNKGGIISFDEVRAAVEKFKHHAGGIRQDTEVVQETTFNTYAEAGRENVDGKCEYGERKTNSQLILGDELELDSLRNMSLKKISVNGKEYEYKEDLLGRDLNEVIAEGVANVSRIILAEHSGKQRFRDLVEPWRFCAMSDRRQRANDAAAEEVTESVYMPVAQALSDRFGREVGYILQAA